MESGLKWFNEARFGMFIHWGAYSVAARGEWIMNRENIPFNEYSEKYAANFKAENYDPEEWVRLAKAAGMKYMVLTARHHDGFALWDTKTTDFNAMKIGPKKDLVRAFVKAVRSGGLKVGLYFSGADWRHPDYPDAFCRDWPLEWPDEEARRRFESYYKEQVRELMTNYGKIDILFYDGCIPEFSNSSIVNNMAKKLQPGILINARNGMPYDFVNSERAVIAPNRDIAWEAAMTLNENWGYNEEDDSYKTAKDVVNLLVQAAKGGGNLLLNVGPKADGTIPKKSVRILYEVGDWLRRNGEFLSGSEKSQFSWNNFGHLTQKGNKVYVHIFHGTGSELCLAEIKNRVLDAYYVDSGEKVQFAQSGNRLFLKNLPAPLKDKICTTIAVVVDGKPKPSRKQQNFWVPCLDGE